MFCSLRLCDRIIIGLTSEQGRMVFERLLDDAGLSESRKILDLTGGPLGVLVNNPRMRAGLIALEAIETARENNNN